MWKKTAEEKKRKQERHGEIWGCRIREERRGEERVGEERRGWGNRIGEERGGWSSRSGEM